MNIPIYFHKYRSPRIDYVIKYSLRLSLVTFNEIQMRNKFHLKEPQS